MEHRAAQRDRVNRWRLALSNMHAPAEDAVTWCNAQRTTTQHKDGTDLGQEFGV
jgi:hypothetical protein